MLTGHPGSDAGLTVSEALDAYIEEHVKRKSADPKRQEICARHLKAILGTKTLRSIDIPECRAYTDTRIQEGFAASTIRRELNTLGAAANHVRKWRRLGPDQMPEIELPEVGGSEQIEWFTKEQIAGQFSACNSGRLACFIRIAYFTAARRHSIERLWKTQVLRDSGIIHLARPGEKRTNKRRPPVPVFAEMKPAIDWLFDNSGTEYLFGYVPDFYRPYAQLCEKLGYHGHPHMLRHSRATHMLMDGESIYKVAKLLGDSVATVERVYGHSSIDFVRSSVSGVEGSAVGP